MTARLQTLDVHVVGEEDVASALDETTGESGATLSVTETTSTALSPEQPGSDCLVVDARAVSDPVTGIVETVAAERSTTPVVVVAGDESTREEAIQRGATDALPRSLCRTHPSLVATQLVSLLDDWQLADATRELFQNVSDGLVLHEPESGEIVDVNRQFCEMTGYSHDELVGETVDLVTAPDDEYSYERAQDRIRKARDEGPQLFEWREQRQNGATYPVEVHLSLTTFHGEEHVLASVRDITERKRREREYEQIFNGVQDALLVMDPETLDIREANDAYLDLVGYESLDRLQELGVEGLSAPGDEYSVEAGREIHQRVAETGEPETVEWQAETSDGEHRYLEVKVTPAEIGGEQLNITSHRDITERKRREREYEQIFNGVQGGITINDPETGRLVDVNDSFCDLLGYDREEILDRGVDGISATEEGFTLDRARELISDVIESGESKTFEWVVGTSDGERRTLEIVGTTAEINGQTRYVSMTRDITERKRRAREYEQIFHGVTDTIGIHDPETGELIEVNETLTSLTGYDEESLLEIGAAGLTVETDEFSPDQIGETVDRVMAGEEIDPYEQAIETADGEIRWLEVNPTRAVIDGEQRFLAIGRDVTERRDREQRLQTIIDRIDEAIFMAPVSKLHPTDLAPDFVGSGYEAIWGQPLTEIYETHEEGIFGTVHPEDRDGFVSFVMDAMGAVRAGTGADHYEYEYRIERPDGDYRWVHSDFYPTTWDDSQEYLLIVSRDITDRKARERTLESFHDATAQLTTADTVTEAAEIAVEAAADVFGMPATAVYHYDDSTARLLPETTGPAVSSPSELSPITADETAAWDVFVGEGFKQLPTDGTPPLDVGPGEEVLLVPLGGNGMLVVWDDGDGIDTEAATILAATLEAALNRLRGERQLESRRAELQAQTERAERLDAIAELTQRVEAAITEHSTRQGIQESVCDRLIDVEPFVGAWIATAEVGTDRLTPRTVAGVDRDHAEQVLAAEGTEPHPALDAWETGEPQVVTDLLGSGRRSGWRQLLLKLGAGAVCAVPLTYNGVTYGVLSVIADTPDGFGDRELDVLSQLGCSIGYAITALERQRALESDDTLELEFQGTAMEVPAARLARTADCRVSYERTVRRQDGSVSVYYTLSGEIPDDMATVADDTLPGDVTVVSRQAGEAVLERQGSSWFGAVVSEYGGVLRNCRATSDGLTLSVELPRDADTRTIVERLQTEFPALDLTAQRQHRDTESTPAEIIDRLEQRLSDRQYEALETGHAMGYFEWPRESSGEDLAERLDITQPTVNKHIRLAERKVFDLLFDSSE